MEAIHHRNDCEMLHLTDAIQSHQAATIGNARGNGINPATAPPINKMLSVFHACRLFISFLIHIQYSHKNNARKSRSLSK